jgi:hypothetical protein
MYAMAKKHLALAAAVMMTTALGTGCSGGQKTAEQPTAKAKVAVSALSIQADITKITLTVDAAPGTPAPGLPFSVDLSKAATGNVWTGNVTGIAANATGINRTFTAQAFGAVSATNPIYQGSTIATVIAGSTATVNIILQETSPNPGPANYAPVITALTASNSYVLPGQTGSFSVSAYDPDDATHYNRPAFNGEPLAYLWTATCDNGTLTLGSTSAATTTFTAPAAPVTSALCQVSIKVSETGLANNSSVTTYFTLSVNGNYGSADIFAFPNSYPIVTVRGDLRYNFFTDVAGIPVGQQGDLFFTAFDPDGDDVRFDLTGACGSSFSPVDGLLQNGVALAANQFSGVTQTTASGGPVSPVTASALFTFNPTFAYPSPVVAFTDPTKSCQFAIDVHDLCTAGNCGTGTGSLPNGSNKTTTIGGAAVTSHTTGYLNATAPAQARRAPSVVRAVAPNQLPTSPAATGVQSWDPQKVAIVLPGTAYNLTAEAFDQYEAGPLTAAWSCNTGNMPQAAVVNTQTNGVKSLKSASTWTSPATLVGAMSCTVTFTSTASALSTVVTFQFAGNDPCIGIANNTACTHANKCVAGATCQNSVCTPPTGTFNVTNGGTVPTTGVSGTAACVVANDAFGAPDTCHTAGTCNANTGACSNPIVTVQTTCNADNSGCTVADSCNLTTGACVAGPAPVCNTPPTAFCYNATPGVCASSGPSSFTCNYAGSIATGATCTAANAAVKCSGTNVFTSFACDATAACVGQAPVACTTSACSTGGSCASTGTGAGTCQGGAPLPNGTACNADSNPCTIDQCVGGTCTANAGGPLCLAGNQSCDPAGAGTCVDRVFRPAVAKQVPAKQLNGIAMNATGIGFAGGQVGCTVLGTGCSPVDFGGVSGTPAGANDAYVVSYAAANPYNPAWVAIISGQGEATSATDQGITGVAALANGGVAAAGVTNGGVLSQNGAINLANSGNQVFLATFDGAGAAKSGSQFGINNGLVYGIASTGNRFAICGSTDFVSPFAASGFVYNGGTSGTNRDIFVAVYDVNATTGVFTQAWAKQLGGGSDEYCSGITFDDAGNVVITGQYNADGTNATVNLGGGALLDPNLTVANSVARRAGFVAKYSSSGAWVSNGVFGNFGVNGAASPKAVAVDASGNVYVAGSFTISLPICTTYSPTATGCLTTLASAGNTDAFVVKFSSSYVPQWSDRLGAPGTTPDTYASIAVSSFGEVLVGGAVFGASTNGGATPTISFPYTAGFGSEAVLVQYTATGAVVNARQYGGAGGQGLNQVLVNRTGTGAEQDMVMFGGPYDTGIVFPPLVTSLPITAGAAYVTFAPFGLPYP